MPYFLTSTSIARAVMSGKVFSARDFLEHKILGWETSRYSDPSQASTLVECWANRSSNSLRSRLKIAETILLPHVEVKLTLIINNDGAVIRCQN